MLIYYLFTNFLEIFFLYVLTISSWETLGKMFKLSVGQVPPLKQGWEHPPHKDVVKIKWLNVGKVLRTVPGYKS